MWDPKTGRVHESRDVIWLKRMFYEKSITKGQEVGNEPDDFEIDNDEEEEYVSIEDGEGDDEEHHEEAAEDESEEDEDEEQEEVIGGEETTTATTRSGRTISKAPRLIEEMGSVAKEYKIELTRAEENYYEAMREFPQGEFDPGEIACVGA